MAEINLSALKTMFEALVSGKPLTLTLQANPTADGAGLQLAAQVGTSSATIDAQPTQPIETPQPTQTGQPVPPSSILPVPPPIPPVAPPIASAPPTGGTGTVPPTLPVATAAPAATSSPVQYQSVTHPLAIPDTLKTPFPYPTNAWWENIILGKERIAPDPYQISVVDNGFLACYPSQNFAQDSFGMQHITTQWLMNFSLEFAENAGSWAVTNEDPLTITLKWTASNGQSATSIIAQGCPYLSMAYSNLTPLLTSQHLIVSVNGATNQGSYMGNKFKFSLNNGQTWILYCSQNMQFVWKDGQFQGSASFTGVVRLAYLDTAADEAILDQYASPIPVSSTVAITESGYTFTWKTIGSGPLLMMAYPHHMDILQSPQAIPNFTRKAIKGQMQGIVGTTWTLQETLPTITWTASKPINPQYKDAIAAQLKKDAGFVPSSTSDTYFAGKALAKLARLLLIADEVGDTESVALIQGNLKTALSAWFDRNDLLAYDKTHGAIVYLPSIGDNGSDFGFSNTFSDHVFHMGYYAYSAAVLAKYDQQWKNAYQEKVTELVHDFCNPIGSNDTRYPTARNKDMYAGHSWAGGLTSLADNRNLESTSEAINGYYGAMLWGVITSDTALQTFAAMLTAMEMRSAMTYWHGAKKIHAPQWTSSAASLMWSSKLDDSTWFSSALECRRGIQILPLTPISEAYLDKDFVQSMVSGGEMTTMLGQAIPQWKGIILAALAVVDPASAWEQTIQLSACDDGQTLSNLLHWIATRG